MVRAKTALARSRTFDLEVAKRIRSRRIHLKMSQNELARKLGIRFQQLWKYENGSNRVGAGRLPQIAKALGVPLAFFFEGSDRISDANSVLRLDTPFKVRLACAFSRIEDEKIQRRLVLLIEMLADRMPLNSARSRQ